MLKNLILAALLGLFACCAACSRMTTGRRGRAFRTIARRTLPYPDLVGAIRDLGPASGTPQFWSAITNDPGYSGQHRRLCVFELFARHVRPGMTLREVSVILGGAHWLDERWVWEIRSVFGWIPLKWLPLEENGTILCITVFPHVKAVSRPTELDTFPGGTDLTHWQVYIGFAGDGLEPRHLPDNDQLVAVLRGKMAEGSVARAVVREVAFYPSVGFVRWETANYW